MVCREMSCGIRPCDRLITNMPSSRLQGGPSAHVATSFLLCRNRQVPWNLMTGQSLALMCLPSCIRISSATNMCCKHLLKGEVVSCTCSIHALAQLLQSLVSLMRLLQVGQGIVEASCCFCKSSCKQLLLVGHEHDQTATIYKAAGSCPEPNCFKEHRIANTA